MWGPLLLLPLEWNREINTDLVFVLLFKSLGDAFVTCNKQSACPGETVQCTCMTAQSAGLAWSSDQLIGLDGARLNFSSSQGLGTKKNSSISNTFAELTESFSSNGVSQLESRITFMTSSVPTDITLACFNVDRGKSDNVTIPPSSKCLGILVHCVHVLQFVKSTFARNVLVDYLELF